MIKGKTKFVQASFETEELGARNALLQNYEEPPHSKKNTDPVLEGDAKVLYEAYKAFSAGGLTFENRAKLEKIDEVLNPDFALGSSVQT